MTWDEISQAISLTRWSLASSDKIMLFFFLFYHKDDIIGSLTHSNLTQPSKPKHLYRLRRLADTSLTIHTLIINIQYISYKYWDTAFPFDIKGEKKQTICEKTQTGLLILIHTLNIEKYKVIY